MYVCAFGFILVYPTIDSPTDFIALAISSQLSGGTLGVADVIVFFVTLGLSVCGVALFFDGDVIDFVVSSVKLLPDDVLNHFFDSIFWYSSRMSWSLRDSILNFFLPKFFLFLLSSALIPLRSITCSF